jgi:hypothetical protein
MKKLMIAIVMVSIAIGANAQKPVTIPKPGSGIIKIDPNKNPKVTTKWILDVKKLPLNGYQRPYCQFANQIRGKRRSKHG